jgi:subtilisin family serine protease
MSHVLVTLNKNVDYEEFWNQMEHDTTDAECECVPNRVVDCSNRKPLSNRTTEYDLTDHEIEHLKHDERVMGIDVLPPENAKQLLATQTGTFARSSSTNSAHINWALRRCTESIIESSPGNTYDYNLDGTGVDVVIQDNGVMSGHPDFEDADGNTRFIEHNWYSAAGISGSMSSNHYGDVGSHGTHVASTVAGKLYGWAKNAKIYSIRFDSGGGISDGDEFDLIRLWHEQKPIDPNTGFKRPTIVNASWGYRWFYPGNGSQGGTITELNYRGTNRGTATSTIYGNTNSTHNIYGVTSIDAATEDLTDAGVIFVKAAGNYYHKQDLVGGADYDNHYICSDTWAGIVSAGNPIYYHRPGSPHSDDAIVVGNVYTFPNGTTQERLSSSSEKGPRCDIFAPGSHITAATNSAGYSTNSAYPGNSSYKIAKISGTSMASPQVCGILALFLQVNPHATTADCKKFLTDNSQSIMDMGNSTGTDYSDGSSTQGGPNRFLHLPWNSSNMLTVST